MLSMVLGILCLQNWAIFWVDLNIFHNYMEHLGDMALLQIVENPNFGIHTF